MTTRTYAPWFLPILIGIVVVLLLVGIFLPALGHARRSARGIGPTYEPDPVMKPDGIGEVSGGTAFWSATHASDDGPFSAVSAVDEVWVIVPAGAAAFAPDDDPRPGTGSLLAAPPGSAGTAKIAVPLEHTQVSGRIDGFVASVEVVQRFHNPYDETIEAEYVFPLPQNAAIRDFVMTIGDRKIVGLIRRRSEADAAYAEAREAGYAASIMTQERPNIFTQRVANIDPGHRIEVSVEYFNPLAYVDGWFEFVFPMVVGPRYNPASAAGAGVGAVARRSAGTSGQRTEVSYLAPGERSGHDISLRLDLHAGLPIEGLECLTHKIETERNGDSVAVRLRDQDEIPNRDFVLRYRVSGDRVRTSLLTQPGDNGEGYFALLLTPPEAAAKPERAPVEFVFVIDCSGSMRGEPISQVRQAVRAALDLLRPDDFFQIVRFSNSALSFAPSPVPATADNIARGRRFVNALDAGGGTEMLTGIRASLGYVADPGRRRYVTLLTDGFIGNEDEILTMMERSIGNSRVFSFGVGSSPNRFLMDRVARVGRGAVTYLGLNDQADTVMAAFFDRVSRPAMSGIELDWGGPAVSEQYPKQIPDLFVGRPVVISGRYRGEVPDPDRVHVRGQIGRMEVSLPIDATDTSSKGLDAVWARMKIADLTASQWRGMPQDEVRSAIEAVALQHGLLSAHTAFLAVDPQTVTTSTHGVTVAVPVPVPEGVRYETTVDR